MSPLRVTRNVAVSGTVPGTLRSRSVAMASVAVTVSTCVSSSTMETVALFATGSARNAAALAMRSVTVSIGSEIASSTLVMFNVAEAAPIGMVSVPESGAKSVPLVAVPLTE